MANTFNDLKCRSRDAEELQGFQLIRKGFEVNLRRVSRFERDANKFERLYAPAILQYGRNI
jgi:hypothetical protein